MELLGLSRASFTRTQRVQLWLVLWSCGVLLRGSSSFAISVEEAYRAIPHRYTPFESRIAKMSSMDAAVLNEFFRLVNLAIVERVQAQAWFQSNGKTGVPFANYQRRADGLVAQLERLTLSENLQGVRRNVIDALKDQRAYFEEWQRAVRKGESFKYPPGASPHHPRVLSSSQKLQQAYGRLLQIFPWETERTKQAFFDHLCALDFI